MQIIFKSGFVFLGCALLAACESAPQTQRDVYAEVLRQEQKQVRESGAKVEPQDAEQAAPHILAAGDDALALRATPSPEYVGDIYHWVHTSDYADIETRLRGEITHKTQRLYTREDGAAVKFMDADAVYYWSAKTEQVRRGTWDIQEGKFGPQICETFYGTTVCLNTAEQLSGVGVIDTRSGDVFGLARAGRPSLGAEGLPSWP